MSWKKSAVNRFGKKVRFTVYHLSDFSDLKSGNSEGEFSCFKQENLGREARVEYDGVFGGGGLSVVVDDNGVEAVFVLEAV